MSRLQIYFEVLIIFSKYLAFYTLLSGKFMDELINKVWFTYKARIRASERLQGNNTHSQFLLVWYALISASLTIATIKYPKLLGDNTDITSAILSVALLVISLLVTNVDYRGRAIEMRRNYLSLQRLYNSLLTQKNLSVPTQSILDEYTNLLEVIENHSSIDDKYWRVIFSPNTSRPVTCTEKLDVYLYLALRYSILVIGYLLPVLVGVTLLKICL